MRKSGLIYLLTIYIVWGSTYLAMRVGIAPGSGFTVFFFGAARCLIACILLVGLAALTSGFVFPKPKEFAKLAGTGLAMWIGAHGLVLWSEQYVASGFAAVAVSAVPLWVLIISMILDKALPRISHVLYIGIGFVGVGVLMFPELQSQRIGSVLALVYLVAATVVWAACAVYLKRKPIRLPAFTISAWQHLFGGLGFLLIGILRQEPVPAPTNEAMAALVFLVIFGSIIAFTSYIKVLTLLPTELVTTNTYVNPVIAVFLGWLILDEVITLWTVLAIGLVVFSIAGIMRNNRI
ncbi:EamA family transporter [bacterium]|nr:EamA family transporter [bacterium]